MRCYVVLRYDATKLERFKLWARVCFFRRCGGITRFMRDRVRGPAGEGTEDEMRGGRRAHSAQYCAECGTESVVSLLVSLLSVLVFYACVCVCVSCLWRCLSVFVYLCRNNWERMNSDVNTHDKREEPWSVISPPKWNESFVQNEIYDYEPC